MGSETPLHVQLGENFNCITLRFNGNSAIIMGQGDGLHIHRLLKKTKSTYSEVCLNAPTVLSSN